MTQFCWQWVIEDIDSVLLFNVHLYCSTRVNPQNPIIVLFLFCLGEGAKGAMPPCPC